jgi:hypothetical protein
VEGVCRACFSATWVAEICIRAAAVLPSGRLPDRDTFSRPSSSRHLLLCSVTGCSITGGFISFGNDLLCARLMMW